MNFKVIYCRAYLLRYYIIINIKMNYCLEDSEESSASILEGSVPSSASERNIRSSKLSQKTKTVALWTPVMVGQKAFAQHHQKETLTYKSGTVLH